MSEEKKLPGYLQSLIDEFEEERHSFLWSIDTTSVEAVKQTYCEACNNMVYAFIEKIIHYKELIYEAEWYFDSGYEDDEKTSKKDKFGIRLQDLINQYEGELDGCSNWLDTSNFESIKQTYVKSFNYVIHQFIGTIKHYKELIDEFHAYFYDEGYQDMVESEFKKSEHKKSKSDNDKLIIHKGLPTDSDDFEDIDEGDYILRIHKYDSE